MKMKGFKKTIKADLTLLLNKFQQTESVRFEVFSEIWRNMKFEQIFYGMVEHESRSFTRLLLDSVYHFLFPPFTFQIRVGGLYLMYALFYCQRAEIREQLRLSLNDWDELLTFEKDSIEAQHFDVVYVLRKLLHEKAFVFTAAPRLLDFEKKMILDVPQLTESFMEKPSAPQTLINNDFLEELSNVHGLYSSLKSSLCPQSESESGLNLCHQNLVPNLRKTVLDFYRWQQDKFAKSLKQDDCGEGTSSSSTLFSQQQSSRRADLLASIKSRAYGEAAEVLKSRRHRVVELDQDNKREPNPDFVSKYKKKKMRSLKYRTEQNLSGTEVSAEVFSNTHVRCLSSLYSDDKPPRSFKKFKWKLDEDF